MNCRVRNESTPDAFDIFQFASYFANVPIRTTSTRKTTTTIKSTTTIPTSSNKDECYFERTGNSAILDTGSPYSDFMRHGFE